MFGICAHSGPFARRPAGAWLPVRAHLVETRLQRLQQFAIAAEHHLAPPAQTSLAISGLLIRHALCASRDMHIGHARHVLVALVGLRVAQVVSVDLRCFGVKGHLTLSRALENHRKRVQRCVRAPSDVVTLVELLAAL